MDHFPRRIIDFGIHAGVVDGGTYMGCMFYKVVSGKGTPQRLSFDNDPLFRYHQWQANLRIPDVEEIKSIPYTPTSHPFIERLIGNRVEEQFGVNILISYFSGISRTWRENTQISLNSITRIGHINHLTAKRLTLSAVMFNLVALCSINIHGVHTATDYFRLQLPHDV